MKNIKTRLQSKYYSILALAIVLYATLTLFGPKAPNKYDLSDGELILIRLTVIVPIVLIWIAAFYGAVRFKAYAESIKSRPDGKALTGVADAIMILAIGLVVTSLLGTLRQFAINNDYEVIYSIVRNYVAVAFPLIAFYKLFTASRGLVKLTDKPSGTSNDSALAFLATAGVSIAYTAMLLQYPYRNDTPDPQTYCSYFLPDALIVLTIIVPYVLSWFLGILAAVNIAAYSRHAKGLIYKKALSNLVKGIVAVTIFSVFLQLLDSVADSVASLSLAKILALVYVIIIGWAVGYLLIASGAKKLTKIEEVK